MTTVTGSFTVVLDGVSTTRTFSAMPYAEFWRRQRQVLRTLNKASDWGCDSLLGLPPAHSGAPTGDVRYEYQVDFAGGGTSEGSNRWNGIPADAAAELAADLIGAFAA